MHPLFSILNIYNPDYNRKLRTLDFLLKIHISIFLTILPLYFTPNPNTEANKSQRDVKNFNKKIGDYNVQITQVKFLYIIF